MTRAVRWSGLEGLGLGLGKEKGSRRVEVLRGYGGIPCGDSLTSEQRMMEDDLYCDAKGKVG